MTIGRVGRHGDGGGGDKSKGSGPLQDESLASSKFLRQGYGNGGIHDL
jgi:hypothetical protein